MLDLTVLRAAAALGTRFELEDLCATLGHGCDEVRTALRPALRGGVIMPERRRRGEPAAYRFRHALVHRACYEQIPALERRRLHAAVLRALEARPTADREAHRLAYHAGEAGLAGPALEYRLLAGEDAARVGAFDDALASLRAAETLALAIVRRVRAAIEEVARAMS